MHLNKLELYNYCFLDAFLPYYCCMSLGGLVIKDSEQIRSLVKNVWEPCCDA